MHGFDRKEEGDDRPPSDISCSQSPAIHLSAILKVITTCIKTHTLNNLKSKHVVRPSISFIRGKQK